MSRLLRALLPALVVGLVATPAAHLMAQSYDARYNGCGNPYRAAYEKCRDSVDKAAYEEAVLANAKRLQEQGAASSQQNTSGLFDDIPVDPIKAGISRARERLRQDSIAKADPYAALVPTDPFDAALKRVKEEARRDSLDRLEEAQRRVDEEKRERLGRWLWAVPLSVLALVVLVAVRGEPVKAWIGRLHGGQVFILASSLLVGGLLSLVAALFIDSIPTAWLTGFVPVGAVSAVLVLWFWFGARAKPKGDA